MTPDVPFAGKWDTLVIKGRDTKSSQTEEPCYYPSKDCILPDTAVDVQRGGSKPFTG